MTVFMLVWCSIFFDFAFGNVMADSFMSPGGRNGEVMKGFLYDAMGVVGLVLLLALSMLLFVIWQAPKVIGWLQELFGFVPKNEDEDEEQEELEDAEETGVEPDVVPVDENVPDVEEDEEPGDNDDVTVVIEDLPVPEDEGDAEVVDEDLETARKFDELAGGLTTGEDGEVSENAAEDELEMEVEEAEGDDDMGGKMLRPINPKDELSYYKPPTLDLLDEYEQGVHSIDKDEQAENANNIVKALRNFGIEISSIKATVGPTITLYEITPAPGVRI